MTVADVIDHYLRHLRARVQARTYSADAYADMERELKRFAVRHGHQALHECKRHDLTGWLDANPQLRSNHTRKRVLGYLIRPFLWAEDEELIPASPYRKPKRLKLRTRPRRPAEGWEYVVLMHLAEGFIRLEQHKSIDASDDCPPRIIGLEPCLVRFLANLERRRRPGVDHVFLNSRGQPWKTRQVFSRHFRRAADRCGLPKDLKPYCVRHLYGTTAIEAGVGERQLADQMGHASTRMVSWYAHTARRQEHLKRVAVAALKRPK